MFFHQDDIGVLIDLANTSFWEAIWISQGEHFSPLYNIVWAVQYRVFHLSFFPYVLFPLFVHFFNLILLSRIVKTMGGGKTSQIISVLLFTASVTFTEPLLWFTVHGIGMATLFVGLAFYFWLKIKVGTSKKERYFWLSLCFSFLSGFVFGLGIGVGVVFSLVSFLWKRNFKHIFFYTMTGLISYLLGPSLFFERVGNRIIEWRGFEDVLQYAGFVVVGVSRGVVGRLFLPGFEPPNENVIGTVISFIPFLSIVLFCVWIFNRQVFSREKVFLSRFFLLAIFTIYPYVWAGFLRYQFGFKQALSERYAYPSLFFFVIIVALLINYVLKKGIVRSQKLFIGLAFIIFIFQLYFFQISANKFEIRPNKTKKYFEHLESRLTNGENIKKEPLPKFIDQDFLTTEDLIPVLKKNKSLYFFTFR